MKKLNRAKHFYLQPSGNLTGHWLKLDKPHTQHHGYGKRFSKFTFVQHVGCSNEPLITTISMPYDMKLMWFLYI